MNVLYTHKDMLAQLILRFLLKDAANLMLFWVSVPILFPVCVSILRGSSWKKDTTPAQVFSKSIV